MNTLFGLRGRMRRLRFFLLLALNQALALALVTVAFMVAWAGPREVGLTRDGEDVALGILFGLLALTSWIYVAIAVKRLHDLDCSGWHVAWITAVALAVAPMTRGLPELPGMLVAFLSLAGVLWLILARGTPGPNRYGPEPGTPPRGSVPTVGGGMTCAQPRPDNDARQ